MLVVSDRTERFHSAETGWLEGHVHNLLSHSHYGRPSNKLNPGDDSVPTYDQPRLWNCVEGVAKALRLLGYETAEEEEIGEAVKVPRTKRQIPSTSVADLLAVGLLTAGEQLASLNGQWPGAAIVTADGQIEYADQFYASPSAAASAVREGGAANGWSFWGVVREGQMVPLAMLRAELASN